MNRPQEQTSADETGQTDLEEAQKPHGSLWRIHEYGAGVVLTKESLFKVTHAGFLRCNCSQRKTQTHRNGLHMKKPTSHQGWSMSCTNAEAGHIPTPQHLSLELQGWHTWEGGKGPQEEPALLRLSFGIWVWPSYTWIWNVPCCKVNSSCIFEAQVIWVYLSREIAEDRRKALWGKQRGTSLSRSPAPSLVSSGCCSHRSCGSWIWLVNLAPTRQIDKHNWPAPIRKWSIPSWRQSEVILLYGHPSSRELALGRESSDVCPL